MSFCFALILAFPHEEKLIYGDKIWRRLFMKFEKPLEMPRGTHYGSNYFIVYSKKIGRVMKFYSSLEYYNFLTLEMNPSVVMFCEQPCEIRLFNDLKDEKAIPDLWVKYKDGTEEFQEVKYSSELVGEDAASLRSQEQIRREKIWCKNNQIGFKVRTEKEISLGRCYVMNLELLAAKNRIYQPIGNEYYTEILRKTLEDGKKTVEELIKMEILPQGKHWEHLSYLYYIGFVSMNIENHPLSNRTEVLLCQKS